MTLNAVQQLVRADLDGLTSPYLPPAKARIAPLQYDDMGTQPLLYIWGAHGQKTRRTAPRALPGLPGTGGFRKTEHKVRIWVNVAMAAGDSHIDTAVPILIEAAMQSLTQIPIAATLTDSDTGAISQLLSIGEQYEWDYDVIRGLEQDGMFALTALIIATVEEDQQG